MRERRKTHRTQSAKKSNRNHFFSAMTQALFFRLHNFVFIFRGASQNYKRNVKHCGVPQMIVSTFLFKESAFGQLKANKEVLRGDLHVNPLMILGEKYLASVV
jgi:hypothetical protein